jgi:hypothetical protein
MNSKLAQEYAKKTSQIVITCSQAAAKFGFKDHEYFRECIAPDLELRFFKLSNKWYTTQEELDCAVVRRMDEVHNQEDRRDS